MKFTDVKTKAGKIYESKEIFRAFLEARELFPLVITLPRITSSELRQDFSLHRQLIEELSRDCAQAELELSFKTVNHRTLGEQRIPHEVRFGSREVFLKLISKKKEFDLFKKTLGRILNLFPGLKEFVIKHPEKILEYEVVWPKLLIVCEFIVKNPRLGLYIRQLEIPGVDTKFIQSHKRILSELLNVLMPYNASQTYQEVSVDLFEERCGLRKEEPRLRFRLLDPSLRKLFFDIEDLEVSVAELAKHEIPCENVFIIENKITGLCLVDRAQSVVFFELGYKAELLKHISWLQTKRIIYWGDIDTHGFAILSRLRAHFPQIESRLMNRQTLLKHKYLWTTEAAPFTGECLHLTNDEQELFQDLKWNRFGIGVRLEQERIALSKFAADF